MAAAGDDTGGQVDEALAPEELRRRLVRVDAADMELAPAAGEPAHALGARHGPVRERHPPAEGGGLDCDVRYPVEAVIPAVAVEPAVGLEQTGREAVTFGGAPERLRLGRFRVSPLACLGLSSGAHRWP